MVFAFQSWGTSVSQRPLKVCNSFCIIYAYIYVHIFFNKLAGSFILYTCVYLAIYGDIAKIHCHW